MMFHHSLVCARARVCVWGAEEEDRRVRAGQGGAVWPCGHRLHWSTYACMFVILLVLFRYAYEFGGLYFVLLSFISRL